MIHESTTNAGKGRCVCELGFIEPFAPTCNNFADSSDPDCPDCCKVCRHGADCHLKGHEPAGDQP